MKNFIEKENIQAVLIKYAEACDRRDWTLYDEVFHADVAVDYGGKFKFAGREALVAMIKNLLGGCGPTQHLLGNFKINVADDHATCSCYVRAAHSGAGGKKDLFYEVWAEYRDELVKVGEQWQITKREMIIYKEIGSRDVLGPELTR